LSAFPGKRFKGFYFWSTVLVLIVVLTALSAPGLEFSARLAVLYGGLISIATSISGYSFLSRSVAAPSIKFIKLVLGGIVLRLFGALGLIALGIGIFRLPPVPLGLSCLGAYVVCTLVEYRYICARLTFKS
jgi:hypothetical protein